jgi:hypothetical protein
MINLQGFVVLMKYTRKKLDEYEFELKKQIPMMQFVSILREKMQL